MKASKTVIPIILIVTLSLAWFSFFSEILRNGNAYRSCVKDAQTSIEEGLYEQAVEFYKESLKYKANEATYTKIKETYELLYAEEHTQFIRSLYIEDMELAAAAFPENEEFWLAQIDLYMEAQSYSKAYATAKQALNYGVKGEKLDSRYKTLLYLTKTGYKLYTDFKMALNGYITVSDGANWFVLDEQGNALTSRYKFAGLINDDGMGLYTNKIDTRLLDIKEVPRARFDVEVTEAGYYNQKSGLIPVKVDGMWKYMDLDGEFLPGSFDVAGSFYNRKAVAKTNNVWVLVNEDGKQEQLPFEDIKLDLYGCHIQNDVIIAMEGGKYHLYDLEFNQIPGFEADDIDICIDPDRIAYKSNGKWGFVNSKGEVVVQPQYPQAKSFSNGYAAICNDDGLWGFINKNYDLVIDHQFVDAYYFTQAETCMISNTIGIYQMIQFMFE